MTTKNVDAESFLNSLVGPLTFGKAIRCIRQCDEMSQVEFAKKLGLSKSHLCDIEQDRKTVSPERAARFAKILGYSREQFVCLSLQALIDKAGLSMTVSLSAA